MTALAPLADQLAAELRPALRVAIAANHELAISLQAQLLRKGKGAEPIDVAGIAVVAADTGRCLLLQRDYDDAGDNQAAGRWEWPAGHLNPSEDPWEGAKREWQEETGNKLPLGKLVTTWHQNDYLGFVYLVPKESVVHLNPDLDDMDVQDPDHPGQQQTEVMAWWQVKDAKHSRALREEFKDFDFDLLDIDND